MSVMRSWSSPSCTVSDGSSRPSYSLPVPSPGSREFAQTRYAPPSGALDLLLVRHGASMPWAPGRDFPLVGGHGDPELSPAGVEQAELVGERLAGEVVDALYVSNLRRTAQTAAPLVQRTGLVPTVEA